MSVGVAERPVEVGQIVAGRFRVEGVVGEGGMAHVYAARDLTSEREVALKLLKPIALANAEIVARFSREAEALSRLRHPAVVELVARGFTEEGRLFLAMEKLEGETLRVRLDRGPLSLEEVAPLMAGIAVGLAAAHEAGILHRDLKPENIFLVRAPGGGVQVKLLDFGISKLQDMDRLTRTGQVIGTPRYMAPEQLEAKRDVDARVDVYAMGVILYEALAGQRPFKAKSASDVVISIMMGRRTPLAEYRPDLSTEVAALVERAFDKDRDSRPATPMALAEALVDLLPGRTTPSRPVASALRRDELLPLRAAGLSTPPPGDDPGEDPEVPGLSTGFPWLWTLAAFAVGGALAYALLSHL